MPPESCAGIFLPTVGRQANQRQLEADQHRDHRVGQVRALAKRHGDVLGHAQRREQGAVLEQHAEAAAQPVHLLVARLPDAAPEQAHRAAGRPQEADDLLEQHRLAGAAAADQGGDLAADDRKGDAVVHDVGAEARADVDDLEGVFAHTPARCKAIAKTASSTITQTMLCTTVEVVCSPTLRASRSTDRPMRQAITAMALLEHWRLGDADDDGADRQHRMQPADERARRDVELGGADDDAAGDAGQVADEDKQRQADDDGDEARNHQHLDRREAEGTDRVGLFLYLHRADLRREGRARAAGDDHRDEQRRQLAADGDADAVDDEDGGAVGLRLHAEQIGEDDADQKAHQRGDRNRVERDDL